MKYGLEYLVGKTLSFFGSSASKITVSRSNGDFIDVVSNDNYENTNEISRSLLETLDFSLPMGLRLLPKQYHQK